MLTGEDWPERCPGTNITGSEATPGLEGGPMWPMATLALVTTRAPSFRYTGVTTSPLRPICLARQPPSRWVGVTGILSLLIDYLKIWYDSSHHASTFIRKLNFVCCTNEQLIYYQNRQIINNLNKATYNLVLFFLLFQTCRTRCRLTCSPRVTTLSAPRQLWARGPAPAAATPPPALTAGGAAARGAGPASATPRGSSRGGDPGPSMVTNTGQWSSSSSAYWQPWVHSPIMH